MPLRSFPPPWSIEGIGYNFRAWQLCRAARIGGKMEDGQALLIWLIVGATAGWLAGMPVKGGGNGLIGDITAPLPTAWITTIVGIIGGLIAGWIRRRVGPALRRQAAGKTFPQRSFRTALNDLAGVS
jgi:uncharacterized membrane protein YeaQ/YmgE (transglycosylase-associated protein family)